MGECHRVAYVNANGIKDDLDISLDWLMGLAVNDSDDIGVIVADYWDQLPAELQDLLGGEQPELA